MDKLSKRNERNTIKKVTMVTEPVGLLGGLVGQKQTASKLGQKKQSLGQIRQPNGPQ